MLRTRTIGRIGASILGFLALNTGVAALFGKATRITCEESAVGGNVDTLSNPNGAFYWQKWGIFAIVEVRTDRAGPT